MRVYGLGSDCQHHSQSSRWKSRRIGLSEFKQVWIIVSEYNYDIQRSFSLEPPASPLPNLSQKFLKTVLKAFRPTLAAARSRVDRL